MTVLIDNSHDCLTDNSETSLPNSDVDNLCTLFLGDLSYFCTEDDLKKLFGHYGKPNNVRVRRGPNGDSLMHAFLTLDSPENAQNAIKSLDGQMYMGRHIRVQLSTEGQTSLLKSDNIIQVHVSFISKQTKNKVNEEILRSIFLRFGNIVDVTIKKHAIAYKQSKQSGYGFVYFNDPGSAFLAMNTLKHKTINEITFDCSISHKSEHLVENYIKNNPSKILNNDFSKLTYSETTPFQAPDLSSSTSVSPPSNPSSNFSTYSNNPELRLSDDLTNLSIDKNKSNSLFLSNLNSPNHFNLSNLSSLSSSPSENNVQSNLSINSESYFNSLNSIRNSNFLNNSSVYNKISSSTDQRYQYPSPGVMNTSSNFNSNEAFSHQNLFLRQKNDTQNHQFNNSIDMYSYSQTISNNSPNCVGTISQNGIPHNHHNQANISNMNMQIPFTRPNSYSNNQQSIPIPHPISETTQDQYINQSKSFHPYHTTFNQSNNSPQFSPIYNNNYSNSQDFSSQNVHPSYFSNNRNSVEYVPFSKISNLSYDTSASTSPSNSSISIDSEYKSNNNLINNQFHLLDLNLNGILSSSSSSSSFSTFNSSNYSESNSTFSSPIFRDETNLSNNYYFFSN